MNQRAARSLIRDGVAGSKWADLGAGEGTFTLALAHLLVGDGAVWAIDRSADALAVLRRRPWPSGIEVRALQADFTGPLDLPPLDGVLMANALHFVSSPQVVIEQVLGYLAPGGGLLVVEYDREDADPWVPHPISLRRLGELGDACGLSEPREVGRTTSRYGREMYAAVLT